MIVSEAQVKDAPAVVETRVVAVERVRLRKTTVTECETVSDQVRRERVEAETLPVTESRPA